MRRTVISLLKKGAGVLTRREIGTSRPVRAVRKLVISRLKSDFADVGSHRMFLDPGDALGLSINEVYEPFQTRLVRDQVQAGDTVLDIGAHIGYYTLIFAELVGESGRVFAFEPEPENFALLKKNVELNGYQNVELVQKAATDKTGSISLYLCDENRGMHRTYASAYCGRSIQVSGVRLDDYFAEYPGEINFIKMDVEGAEYAALQGMPSLLHKNHMLSILTEFAPVSITEFGLDPTEYLGLLVQRGFRLSDVNAPDPTVPLSASDLLEAYTVEKRNFTSLLCTRER